MLLEKKLLDYIFITQIPVFYKVNLYNEIAKTHSIFVIFLSSDTNEKRGNGFVTDQFGFDYVFLSYKQLQNRRPLINALKIFLLIRRPHRRLVLCAWDYVETWLISFVSKKERNCFVLESTVIESESTGLKGLAKRIFLKRFDVVFASGEMQIELCKKIGFQKEVFKTNGVGIINKLSDLSERRELSINQNRFGFVGRIIDEKEILHLSDVFSRKGGFELEIIGTGILEPQLRMNSAANIYVRGPRSNTQVFEIMSTWVALILPSKVEPWGLVVEEALQAGCRVIVSNACGISCLISGERGCYIYEQGNWGSLWRAVLRAHQDYIFVDHLTKMT